MDIVEIKGLEIFAYHGVNADEKEHGQKFLLDVKMWADLSKAKVSDNLSDTVNYAAVRKMVTAAFTSEKCDLIERAGRLVCDAVLKTQPRVAKIRVRVKKPDAPMSAVFDYVAVEITEER